MENHMKKNVFDVVLLNALPASGKSELRKFMNENDPEQMVNDFHIGKNLQLDDFPYVWLMRQVALLNICSKDLTVLPLRPA